ncbi:MAG: transcriptional regulator, IclR family [Glaciihabitans sp.]|jgi:DNA-binding IclR family transcriptional regulator|nr:transcriptional regulator, IclR family [Glaciihabitans sp.]
MNDRSISALNPQPDADAANEGGVAEVKSAARTVFVLEFLASRENEPARLREISDALGVPKSSLYALLRTLSQYGWVRTDASGTLYGIGIRALMAGTSYLDTDPYLRLVQPSLDYAKEQLNETIHFGRLDNTDIVYLATRESSQYLRPYSRVGRRLPASTTAMGKALIAERSGPALEAMLQGPLPQLTPNSIVDVEAMKAEIDATRLRGYSVDLEENTVGLQCFGFALRYANPAMDAISCSVPVARLTPERREEIIAVMFDVRDQIERFAPAPLRGGRDELLAGFPIGVRPRSEISSAR